MQPFSNHHCPSTLLTNCAVRRVSVGNGASIYHDALLPALSSATYEILFVTCFWAPSISLTELSSTLRALSSASAARSSDGGSKLRVRLCFSSRSHLQMLFHTSSPNGYIYPPSQWTSKLGLPSPDELRGLDLQVKSIFMRPFSVMHPKYIIIDRRRAFLPSCNLSWENWFEGCIKLDGPVVGKLVKFWRSSWGRNDLPTLPVDMPTTATDPRPITGGSSPASVLHESSNNLPLHLPLSSGSDYSALLLPSPHHCNPQFRPFPLPAPTPPPTPLNTLLSHLFSTATSSVFITTPNFTSPPVLPLLLSALERGVDVEIVTNRRMMLVEQLLTAGTVTEICLWRLVRAYQKLMRSRQMSAGRDGGSLEEGRGPLGALRIGYYRPLLTASREDGATEPVKLHFKCTIADMEVVVLGSGNMDRASWYTSQELGLAIYDRGFTETVSRSVQERLKGRVEGYFGHT
ncbi:MAG: hypothetical protein FRX48_02158 [Lasallia pustulata]|uniref:PLD phosphodiesterase domain-containing protein n=1 Tax=Lasallia pustulata TaxID=136370 RepID=A0A5M8PVZ2_9LECA|nr:MAG: hypothetical protein FRX48_02158 [Lasallia pustulata]